MKLYPQNSKVLSHQFPVTSYCMNHFLFPGQLTPGSKRTKNLMKRSLDPRLAVLSASETIDVKLAWGLQARQDPVFSCRTVERALQQWGECRKGGCLLPFPALSTTERAVSWGPGRSRTGWTGTALPDLQELPGPQDPIAVFQYRQLWADPSFKNVMPSTCWAA